MRRLLAPLLAAAIGLCAAADANAGTVLFDFDPVSSGSSASTVESYMESVYPGQIDVQDARALNSSLLWPGNTSTYLVNVTSEGDFEIVFEDVGITAVRFDYRVIPIANVTGAFHLSAYDDTYDAAGGTLENPNAAGLVDSVTWTGTGNSGWINFAAPVKVVIFSDSSRFDVAIDNLEVRPVPLPAAAFSGLLLLLGAGGVGRLRKKRRSA